MRGRIENIQIGCAGGAAYEREAGALAALYGALLAMRRTDIGYIKLVRDDGAGPDIGFEDDNGQGDARPRWPDPEYPQQLHLDIEVRDLAAAEAVAQSFGASRLRDNGEYRIYADPVGHPFCLYPRPALPDGPDRVLPGRIARVVFDCFSPRDLARFYKELLDMRTPVLDTRKRVVIAGSDSRAPMLAFQHAVFPPARWPDPAYPAQLHLDVSFDDAPAALAIAEQLGAIRLATMRHHLVYADPASHPFCLSEATETPAADWATPDD